MGLFKEAQIFITKQRIKELENSIRHWPNSDKSEVRRAELYALQAKLERQIAED